MTTRRFEVERVEVESRAQFQDEEIRAVGRLLDEKRSALVTQLDRPAPVAEPA